MANLYLYLGAYILFLIGISYVVSRKQNDEDFLISGRNRGSWQLLLSKVATAIGAGYFITYTGFAYEYGVGVFTMFIGLVVGYLLIGFWIGPKVHAPSQKHKFYTVGDYVAYRTKSEKTGKIANMLANVILLSWVLISIIGGAKIIQDFGLLSYEMSLVVTVAVILIYLLLAGFKAVLLTDVVQSVVIFGLLIIITLSITSTNIISLFSIERASIDIATVISFLLFGVLASFSYANVYQLCYAAKELKHIKRGISFSVLPLIFIGFLLMLIGLFMAGQNPNLDSGLVFTEALKNFLPPTLLPIAIVLFFAGIMSSADSSIYSMASHHVFSFKRDNPVKRIKKITIIFMLLCTGVAFFFRDVVDVSIFAGGMSLTLSIPMVYIFFNKTNPKRFAGSCIASIIGLFAGLFVFGFEPVIVLTTLIGGALGLFWKW